MSIVAMDNMACWEQKMLIHELRGGMELAKQLNNYLNSLGSGSGQSQSQEILLLQGILSSYEKALLILNWNDESVPLQQTQSLPVVSTVPESSLSRDASPRSENCDGAFKEIQNNTPKKRKLMPTWTDQVRVSSENGFEGPIDDGYNWRKYGQKDILGAKYPRSYYRCTYRGTQNCWATKQVQRSDDDPSVFEIIYRGKHNCNQNCSPKKQEQKPKKAHQPNSPQLQQPNDNLLMSFKSNLTVDTKGPESGETDPHFTFPCSSFGWFENKNENISPTFEGNYDFYLSGQMDINEIMSTNTSASNSPILDLDFMIDPVHLDPGFPFDMPGFFN